MCRIPHEQRQSLGLLTAAFYTAPAISLRSQRLPPFFLKSPSLNNWLGPFLGRSDRESMFMIPPAISSNWYAALGFWSFTAARRLAITLGLVRVYGFPLFFTFPWQGTSMVCSTPSKRYWIRHSLGYFAEINGTDNQQKLHPKQQKSTTTHPPSHLLCLKYHMLYFILLGKQLRPNNVTVLVEFPIHYAQISKSERTLLSLLFTNKFSSACQFKNHIEYFQRFTTRKKGNRQEPTEYNFNCLFSTTLLVYGKILTNNGWPLWMDW